MTRRVLIIANLQKEGAESSAREIGAYLETLGIASQIAISSNPTEPYPDARGIDLVVSLGGDGTVLYAARVAAPLGIPILPFNLGRLGFIAGFGRDDWEICIDSWMAGRLGLSARVMLSIVVERGDQQIGSFSALNDGVVSGQGIAKVIALDLRADGFPLGIYRSDGMIIATPTGSTAYNLAAGGPVLHPETDSIVINPICPFTLSHRPLVVPASERIELRVEEGRRTSVMLTVDGQETLLLEPHDRVLFSKAKRKALLHVPEHSSFYEVLRKKLNWSGGSDA
ncbi:MAG: NAD(+)/NADH kinase [Treponema sp.]|nr:NAD(+)/NADH kinase [Treponema sp.]